MSEDAVNQLDEEKQVAAEGRDAWSRIAQVPYFKVIIVSNIKPAFVVRRYITQLNTAEHEKFVKKFRPRESTDEHL